MVADGLSESEVTMMAEELPAFACDWCGRGIGWDERFYASGDDDLVCAWCAAVANADQGSRLLFTCEVRWRLVVLAEGRAGWWRSHLN